MKKKIFVLFVLAVNITSGMFAQEIQRLTFTEKAPDGTFRTVTVNAVFIGYGMDNLRIEGNFVVTRGRSLSQDNKSQKFNQWSDWEILGRVPTRGSLLEIYDTYNAIYDRYPRFSYPGRINMGDGYQAVKVMDIPIGHGSPLWWGEDGKSVNIYYKCWLIVP